MSEKIQWENRITKRERTKLDKFLRNKLNPKHHPHVQQERMKAILNKFGQVGEIYVYDSKRNGGWTIFDGHLRESLDTNQEWDVAYTTLTDSECDELVLFYDPISFLATPDSSRQMDLMQDLRSVDGVLGAFLDELAKDSGFKRSQPPAKKNGKSKSPVVCPHCGEELS